MIEKKIHYCWFGNNEKSELIKKCIDSWKKYCPDYEIIEWNEENFDVNCNLYVKQAYSEKKWAFVSDYARLYIIYNFGGIYLDTDVELIKNIDFMLEDEAFFCFEKENINTGLGFGAKKNNKLVKLMLDDYEQRQFIDENGVYDLTPCPITNTLSISKYIDMIIDKNQKSVIEGIAFYPESVLCPLDYVTRKLYIKEETVAIHWYGASWLSSNQKRILKIKRIIRRIIGNELYENLKSKKRGKNER